MTGGKPGDRPGSFVIAERRRHVQAKTETAEAQATIDGRRTRPNRKETKGIERSSLVSHC